MAMLHFLGNQKVIFYKTSQPSGCEVPTFSVPLHAPLTGKLKL